MFWVDLGRLCGSEGMLRWSEGRGVAPEPLNKCAEGAFQVANGRRSRHETQRSCGDPP